MDHRSKARAKSTNLKESKSDLRDFGLAEAILNAMPNLYSTKEIIN
jgi:hypothetical protein